MDAINPSVLLSLDEFIHEVDMTQNQRQLCDLVLEIYYGNVDFQWVAYEEDGNWTIGIKLPYWFMDARLLDGDDMFTKYFTI